MKTNNGTTTHMTREIRAMRRSVSNLDRSIRRLAPMLKAMAVTNGSEGVTSRRRPRLSVKQRAALKIQGRYMGFMRQLRPKQKAEVRRIREKMGVIAAVRRAESLARA